MTEPDEALIWAREDMAKWCEENDDPDFAKDYRSGSQDDRLIYDVYAYRAGQAASAERIKALEAGVSDAIAYVEFQRPNAVDLDQLLLALRNLLKEADQ